MCEYDDFRGIKETVTKAKTANIEAAKGILEYFCEAVEQGAEVDQYYMIYLAECFREILTNDTDAAKALHLTTDQLGRRPDSTKLDRDVELARKVVARAKQIKNSESRKKAKGYGIKLPSPIEQAIEEIAKENYRSDSTVRKAYETYNWHANLIESLNRPD